ncbi:hypothetical protein FB451DRAFT_1408789 [Mycena latifolia]|nr:hypothetical protein FB451DRAFT_1408789 [Mycena latifolia]
MTYTISVAHTLAIIAVLIIGLINLEHCTSRSSFISHLLFRNFLKTPVMTPYSYTPSHKRSWVLDAASTAEDERFPAVTTSKALASATASMASAQKPENTARGPATPSARVAIAPPRPTTCCDSASTVFCNQQGGRTPNLASAGSFAQAQPRPACPRRAATPSDSGDDRIPWASKGKWSTGAPPSRLSASVAPATPLPQGRPTTENFFATPLAKDRSEGVESLVPSLLPPSILVRGPDDLFVAVVRRV